MLRVHVHTGLLRERNAGNVVAVIDIGYVKKAALADYMVGMTRKGQGEVEPGFVRQYPRWSASLWDLVARAITQLLYRSDGAPAVDKPDRRCAYATKLCAVIERLSPDNQAVVLGKAEMLQVGQRRGVYQVRLEEDIHGEHTGELVYGTKRLDLVDLLLRGICQALYAQDVPGAWPSLILPATVLIHGEQRFHVQALDEPARTGFERWRGINFPMTAAPEPLARADDYVKFLMEG